ncbi:MAG: PQQ-binding-like beta-propeller repeat protein [Kouleothrix sp.]|nr:PQQ-binding-like beta-propeller repeat protein [Kouleothrix sp.]
MSNYNAPTVFNCPRCGAAVAMHDRQGSCSYCGTLIERPARLGGVLGAASSRAQPGATAGYPKAALHRPRGGVPLLLVLLLAAGAAFGGFIAGRAQQATPAAIVVLPTRGPLAATAITPIELVPNGGSISELVAVLPRDGRGGDLLAYAYHSTSSHYTLELIDGGSHAVRWNSPLLSNDAYQGTVVIGDDQVILTDKDQLIALHRRDGTLAWQSALAVEPIAGCDRCMRLVGGYVAVLEKDSTIQVFSAQSGQPAWSVRLADRPSGITVAGERIVTIVETDNGQRSQINFLDPATGKPTQQLAPACPRKGQRSEYPDGNSSMLFSPDGATMYLAFGFFERCIQAWDLAGGTLRWQATPGDQPVPADLSYGSLVKTDTAIYMGQGGQLWELGLVDGAIRMLAENQEYNLTPIMLSDGTLIVQASPTWDSQRQELWGVDLKTGTRSWQQKLKAHELHRGSSSGDWAAQLTPRGLMVVQVLRDEAQLLIDTIDPHTGASLIHTQHALQGAHMPGLRASQWADDTGWLMIDGDVFAIDLANGQIEYRLS